MATLSAVSNGVRSATATQAGTYTFNTKNKYNNANIAFIVPTGSAKVNAATVTPSSWTITGASGKVTVKATGSATVSGTATAGWVKSVSSATASVNATHDFADANFTAANIKKGTAIFGITGTLDYVKTVTSVPTTKDTSIIYNSTDSKYYLWRA